MSLLRGGIILTLCLGFTGQALAQPKIGTANPAAPGFRDLAEPTRIINELLGLAWLKNKLQPAPRCDDHEFIRRVTLDIIGRLPTVEEIEEFKKLPAATRRSDWVEKLLADPDYTRNWSTLWTHWLMTRAGGNPIYRAQMQLWLEERFAQPTMSYQEMVRDLITATGKSNENGAVQFPLTHLGESQRDRAADGQFDVLPLTARITRVFLGYQIQCAQCHDHFFNPQWRQEHFWGINAYLRQIERVGTPDMNMQSPGAILELRDNPAFNTNAIVYYEIRRNGAFIATRPVFLDGRKIPAGGKLSRREELARFVTSYAVKDAAGKSYEQVSRAFINRMWAQFFGRSMSARGTYDDFGGHNNDVVHEPLLNALAEHFAGSGGHDPRNLIRWITASDAYNLKAAANASNASPETEVFFSRMPLKMMSPEQLLDSLLVATRTPAADQRDFRRNWLDKLVRNFGNDEGSEAVYTGTMLQALLMMNSQEIQQAIGRNAGTVARAMEFRDGKKTLDYLFLSTLSRPASDREYNQILRQLPLRSVKEPAGPGPLQDVLWALLNSSEFILNH